MDPAPRPGPDLRDSARSSRARGAKGLAPPPPPPKGRKEEEKEEARATEVCREEGEGGTAGEGLGRADLSRTLGLGSPRPPSVRRRE